MEKIEKLETLTNMIKGRIKANEIQIDKVKEDVNKISEKTEMWIAFQRVAYLMMIGDRLNYEKQLLEFLERED